MSESERASSVRYSIRPSLLHAVFWDVVNELVFARNLPHLLTESRGVVGYGVAEIVAVATNSFFHPVGGFRTTATRVLLV